MKKTMTEKEKTELYYKLAGIESDLKGALYTTREEPGFPMRDVAKVIKKVFKPEEVRSLINELNK